MLVLFFILFSLLCYVGVVSATDLYPPSDEAEKVSNAHKKAKGSKKKTKQKKSYDDADLVAEDTKENEGEKAEEEDESDSSDDAE
jgi:hypothetical protein